MKKIKLLLFTLIIISLPSCNNFLDIEPVTDIPSEAYFTADDHLGAYTIKLYDRILPSHSGHRFGFFGNDIHTDNQAFVDYSTKYIPGEWRVPENDGSWDFSNIYQVNYFLEKVIYNYENDKIEGNKSLIQHHIGEAYFLRAYEYFNKLQQLGDMPIITKTLPDKQEELTAHSKRSPRNEVARFILKDLDKAHQYLYDNGFKKNRLNKACAQLLKSRVALFESSWLTYFKETAFVPKGKNWPGYSVEYNKDYEYPSGDIDNEIDYFLEQAILSAETIADNIPLEENSGIVAQEESDLNKNRYADMFGALDMSAYNEVLLWRKYDRGLGVTHNIPVTSQSGNEGIGLTRGMINSFLMKDGLPFYASSSENPYKGDDFIKSVKENRDGRMHLFVKEPGQKNVIKFDSNFTYATPIEPIPYILYTDKGRKYTTGYTSRKGIVTDQFQCENFGGFTGCLIFRATEAYLNYIEASYMKEHKLNNKAIRYWKQLRKRAKVSEDIQLTINNTDLTLEKNWDWGAYSAGNLIDKTLFNIRRERRCELMSEGLRWMDLKRWRALDQMITTPYHIEGFKLWGPMQEWYKEEKLIFDPKNPEANVSAPQQSEYLRPYQINAKDLAYNGYKWHMAHYLDPIAIKHILITSKQGDLTTSPIYQNPYWPLKASQSPLN